MDELKVNDKSSIHIYGWMLNELNLSGSELLIYATIFSFTNGTKNHCYQGSAEYLWKWWWLKKRAVFNILKSLEKKWLIFRKERVVNGVKFVDYYTDNDSKCIGDAKNTSDRCKKDTSYNRDIDSNNKKDIIYKEDNISIAPKVQNKGSLLNMDPSELSTLGPVPSEAQVFLRDSYEKYPSIKYQIDKQWEKYLLDTIKDRDKLCKEYWEETVKTVLNYIKQDDFWCKQIQSIGKLRKKNKDWVPYIVVIMDKITQYKPKIIDLDNM